MDKTENKKETSENNEKKEKKDKQDNVKKIISLDNADFTNNSEMINSPRSLEACRRIGVEPSELYQLNFEQFTKKYPDVINLEKKLFQFRYEAEEKLRKDTVEQIKLERKKIIEMEKKKEEKKEKKDENFGNNDKKWEIIMENEKKIWKT